MNDNSKVAEKPKISTDHSMTTVAFKRYRISRRICRRFCFTVYDAVDLMDGSRRFLKMLDRGIAAQRLNVLSFFHTARLNERLGLPQVCRVFQALEVEGRHILVTEPIDAETLSLRLHESCPFPLSRALALVSGIGDVLRQAHLRGVAHGLLNPSCIFLAADDSPKLDDFGYTWLIPHIFRMEDAEALYLSYYVAPELCLDPQTVDGRADIYALGVILLQLLTDEIKFSQGLDPARKHADVLESIPRVEKNYPDHFPTLETILSTCLDARPEARYQNLKEFSDELQELRSQLGEPQAGLPFVPGRETG